MTDFVEQEKIFTANVFYQSHCYDGIMLINDFLYSLTAIERTTVTTQFNGIFLMHFCLSRYTYLLHTRNVYFSMGLSKNYVTIFRDFTPLPNA